MAVVRKNFEISENPEEKKPLIIPGKSEVRKPVERHWYILRAISGKETKAKEWIEAACKNNPDTLGKNIHQVLVPTEPVYITRGGKKVLKERVKMSGYVFVEATLIGETEAFLQNTTNIIDFVRNREKDKKPEIVPQAQIETMTKGIEEQAVADAVDHNYIVGESVKVVGGAFSGFTGEISEVNLDRHELTVIVKVFGRDTKLTLDNSQVARE